MSSTHRPDFPFSAVIGQSRLKTALILNAINPRIGGLLISGPRGSAKSTLARGLADILPAAEDGTQPPFVNLPLGTTEDRLLGTLDLERALNDQAVIFHPGLLARAHGGILYVDEVNLLPDALVDLLLDTTARGINVVERDGISHSHEARFILVGTMNPDEGELRPQLLDRFGLMVQMQGEHSVAERVAIVRQRQAYELDPVAFVEQQAVEQQSLQNRIEQARAQMTDVNASDAIYTRIAEHCLEARVEGMRADVVWLQAALAHTAWHDRQAVTEADLEAVAPWVLEHRSREHPPSNSEPPARPPGAPPESCSEAPEPDLRQETRSTASPSGPGEGAWGAMPPQSQSCVELSHLPLPASTPLQRRQAGSQAALSGSRRRGQQGDGTYRSQQDLDRPDWCATLIANRGEWPPRHWRFRRRRTGQPWLNLVLIDTSGSTLKQQLFGRAKGLVAQLAEQAYKAREQFTVLGFGNDRVQTLLPRQRAPKTPMAALDSWTGGGGTPLRLALEEAATKLHQWRNREPGLHTRTWVITDGRTRESFEGLPALGDCVVVDTEQSFVKRGRAHELARKLGADYLTLALPEVT